MALQDIAIIGIGEQMQAALLRRIAHAIGATLCALLFSATAAAQTYPARAITFVYPYPPGSSSDTAYRTIILEVSKRLGQPIMTFDEAGLPGIHYSAWSGVIGPPGMPRPVVDRLNRAFIEAMAALEVRSKLEGAGLASRGGTPEDWTALIKAELGL